MGWQKIGSESGATWDYKTNTKFEGIFVRKEENVGPNHSNMYHFSVGDQEVGVWGNTLLDMRFKNLVEGERVQIEYKGLEKSPKSGRAYHNFEVSHWVDDIEPKTDEKMPF